MSEAYLDNNATTRLAFEVEEAMSPYYSSFYGNPLSAHPFGARAEEAIHRVKGSLLGLLNTEQHELFFTGGGTQAIYAAFSQLLRKPGKRKHILAAKTEHASVLACLHHLQQQGCEVEYIIPDLFGHLSLQRVIELLRPETLLVCLMHINNELGTIHPVAEIANRVKIRDAGVHVFCDGIQGFGKQPIDLCNIDAYTLSAHKLHGPKGVGAFLIKKEFGDRGPPDFWLSAQGTPNVAGIVGLGKAAELAYAYWRPNVENFEVLKKYFLSGLSACGEFYINSPPEAFANTINLSFLKIPGQVLMQALGSAGVYISTGAACGTKRSPVSHVLKAVGLPIERARSAIRISFSRYTTFGELDYALENFRHTVSHLWNVIC